MRPMKKLKKIINRLSITRVSDEKDCHKPRDLKLDSLMSGRSKEASPDSR